MTDDNPDLEPIDLSGAPYASAPAPAAPAWAPGWYADPWTAGQYRYWNGQTWTGETNRWGPSTANAGAQGDATDPWPAAASPIAGGYGWPDRPAAAPTASLGSTRRRGPIVAGIVILVIVLVASAAVGYAINSNSHSDTGSAVQVTPSTTPPGATPSSGPRVTSPPGQVATPDPDASALDDVGLRPSDVPGTRQVAVIRNGNELSEATLNLCNGAYPSEARRTARVQEADYDAKGDASLGTEAVLYRNAAASEQAFKELRTVTGACPHKPVASPVGGDTAETEFHAAPDTSWKSTPGVERQAYSLTTTATGETSTTIAVYLRRGRALLGLYFPQPKGVQSPVAGQGSIAAIVGVFETRMAKLPASVVNADRT